jgi:Family of unknown function (DUF6526)
MLGEKMPQTFANHARFVPLFHFVTFGLLVVYTLYRLYWLVIHPDVGSVMGLLFAVAVVLLAWSVRTFDCRLQDRIIRLEMRLRLATLLPAELQPRIGELRPGQLVALRFAPDAEIPGLVAEVLAGGLVRGRDIKQRIQSWEPDYFRV